MANVQDIPQNAPAHEHETDGSASRLGNPDLHNQILANLRQEIEEQQEKGAAWNWGTFYRTGE